jgi:membrane associated rhomboid family serine protease
MIGVLWLVHILKITTDYNFGQYGVFPREWSGMKGILFAPFIHGDFKHLISNSVPLLVLTTILIYFYRKVALPVFVIIYILTGFTVWMFARRSYHIGASGVVYGLVSFIFWSGVFRRNIRSIVLALVVTILYSGYFAGIVPGEDGISWESHLFGAIAGLIVAFLVKGVVEDEDIKIDPWADEHLEPERYYLPRDTFEKTKAQRFAEQQQRIAEEKARIAEERIRRSGGWESDTTF